MNENLKKFAIDDIELFRDDEDVDFSIARIGFMADKNNSHKNPISLEVLKKYANTVLGKFVIGDYDRYEKDVTSHTNNQNILGYVPPNSKVTFEEKDGRTFAFVEAVISKLYATDIYKMFKESNSRAVSCEFSAQEGEEDNEGNRPILEFSIHAISVLGMKYKPSIAGTEIKMMKFSETNAEKFYNEHSSAYGIKKFVEERREKLMEKENEISNPINTSKIVDNEWDGDKVKHDAIKEKNFITIAPKIFMKLEEGWKDREVTKLGYPVMTLENGEWVYSKKGLSAALGYARKENETEVINKVEKLYKKFKLGEGEEKKMETKNFAELEGRPLWAEVIKRVKAKLGEHIYVEGIYSNKIVIRNKTTDEQLDIPAKITLGKDDEDMSIEINYDKMKKSEVQKGFAEKDKDKDKTKDAKKKLEDEPEDDDDKEDEDHEGEEDKEDKEKKFSGDENIDTGAYLEMLNIETGEYRDLVEELWEHRHDYNVIMERFVKVTKERDELKKYKDGKEEEVKMLEVDKTMADVKGDIPIEKFDELRDKGKECKFSELDGWKNTVMAFAYKHSKKKEVKPKEDKMMKFNFEGHISKESLTTNSEDIFKKYL